MSFDLGRDLVNKREAEEPAYTQLRHAGSNFIDQVKAVKSRVSTNRVYVDKQVPNFMSTSRYRTCALARSVRGSKSRVQ
jgi:hypothetical protein